MLRLVVHGFTAPVHCDMHQEEGKLLNISGVYQLEEVENYRKYLLAMNIPKRAVGLLDQSR